MISEQSLKDRLRVISQEKNIHFNACWRQILLERFLVRLGASGYSPKFIFKGGNLLAYLMQIGRATMDLDFLLTRMRGEEKELRSAFEKIASIEVGDGFIFSVKSVDLLAQPHMEYPGYRMTLNVLFGRMRDQIQVDVGVGDIVEPKTCNITLAQCRGKPLFESSVSLRTYPIETIFAEKLESVLSKGARNSRMKDYHDLVFLVRNKNALNVDLLKKSLVNTLSHRGTPLQLIQFDEMGYKALDKLWRAHCHGLGDGVKDFGLPLEIEMVIDEINQFLKPYVSTF